MEMNDKFQNAGFRRIMITAPQSGSGKTLITSGLLRKFIKTGLNVSGAKCGPDYIDPMYHRMITNNSSINLDSYFVPQKEHLGEILRQALFYNRSDLCIIEGAMGFYDGLGGVQTTASAYEISEMTNTPVVLVVDAKGASVSLAAVINGMLQFRKNNICGVILNRCSTMYYERLKALVEEECGIKVFGYLPELKKLVIPSRHLGLVAPGEMEGALDWVDILAEAVDQYIDTDAIYEAAGAVAEVEAAGVANEAAAAAENLDIVRIAVARDNAFSFYYEENMIFLENRGVEIVYFSPINDKELPEGISGIILGGGYPELYAKELSRNVTMLKSIKAALDGGMPFLAECGGFLYLQKHLESMNGKVYDMVGFFEGDGIKTNKLVRFGYAELEFRTDGCFGSEGCRLRVHEFHHWDCSDNGTAAIARKTNASEYSCMHYSNRYAAGFPHLYFENNPQAIESWIKICRGSR